MSTKNQVRDLLPEIKLDGDNVPLWNQLSYKNREHIANGFLALLGVIGILIILFPMYWMFRTAFAPRAQLITKPVPLYPKDFTLENFIQLSNTKFVKWYLNTILISLGIVLVTTVAATLGGYGLTRIDLPRKKTFARVILFGYMFPPILLAIPMFILWRQLGWVNSYIGVIFAQTAVSLPFGLWLMWKFFQTVPISLEESAQMSGASRFRAFYEIALPLSKPGMIAVAVFSYAVAWNAFTIPNILLVDSSKWVLTLGLFSLTAQNQVFWGQIMAASALTIIPSFLFVYFLQSYLLRGFRAGDVG